MKTVPTSESQHVESLGRVLDVLDLFTPDSAELILTDIAERLGWPMPTAHRVVSTLLARRFLVRDPATKRLRLGTGVLRLVAPLMVSFTLPELAQPRLRELAQQKGETVNLAVLDGAEVLYVASAPGSFVLRAETPPGLRIPAHCTALGKCMLAQLDPDEVRGRLGAEPYPALTDQSVRTWTQLREQMAAVRENGYAVSVGEYDVGLNSCAVPVATHRGMSAAINVSASASRVSPDDLVRIFVPSLRETATAIAIAQGLESDEP